MGRFAKYRFGCLGLLLAVQLGLVLHVASEHHHSDFHNEHGDSHHHQSDSHHQHSDFHKEHGLATHSSGSLDDLDHSHEQPVPHFVQDHDLDPVRIEKSFSTLSPPLLAISPFLAEVFASAESVCWAFPENDDLPPDEPLPSCLSRGPPSFFVV